MARATGCVLLCLALSCRPDASAKSPEVGPKLPTVDREGPPFAGTWVGPEFSLSFVGEWVLVRPSGEPDRAPIELRVQIERASGDAFALRTSLGAALAADFLRAPDWTLLVEDGQLALAMGDEPLEAYIAQPDAAVVMQGPSMIDEIELPAELRMADAIVCLELGGLRCAALESGGPIAAGCRELQWGLCVAGLGPAPVDPVERAAWTAAGNIRSHALTLRYCTAMVRAARGEELAAAEAMLARARADAQEMLAKLREDGPLPEGDPYLEQLLWLSGER